MRPGVSPQQMLTAFAAVPASLVLGMGLLVVANWVASRAENVLIFVGVLGLLGLLGLVLVKPTIPVFLIFIFLSSPFQFLIRLGESAVLTAVMMACGALGVAAVVLKGRTSPNPLMGRMAALAVVGIWGALYGHFGGNERVYVWGDFFQVIEFVGLFLLTFYLISDDRSLRRLLYVIVISTSLTVVWQFYLFLRGEAAAESFFYYGGAGVGDLLPRTINFGALSIFPLLLAAVIYLHSSRRRAFLWGALLLVTANLLLSFTRGIWIGAFVAVVAAAWMMDSAARKRLLRIGLLMGIVIILAGSTLRVGAGGERWRLMELLEARYRYSFQEVESWQTGYRGGVRRLAEVTDVATELGEFPLFGKGMGATYPLEGLTPFGIRITRQEHYIHNLYLAVALRMGLIGLGLFLWILFVYVRHAYKLANSLPPGFHKAVVVGSAASVVGYMVVSMTSPTLLNHPTCAYAACAMALTLRAGMFARADDSRLGAASDRPPNGSPRSGGSR